MKLTKDITGCVAGAIHPETFAEGADCPDDLLEAAIELGALAEADVEKAKTRIAKLAKARKVAPENKAHDEAQETA